LVAAVQAAPLVADRPAARSPQGGAPDQVAWLLILEKICRSAPKSRRAAIGVHNAFAGPAMFRSGTDFL